MGYGLDTLLCVEVRPLRGGQVSDLQAIRERHERDNRPTHSSYMTGWVEEVHRDRATLLAEVDRLKALCGRAGNYFHEMYEPHDEGCSPEDFGPHGCWLCEMARLITELREASER
jgi:hypothetical protein